MNFELNKINGITVFHLNEKKLDANISGLVKGEFTILVKGEHVSRLIVDLRNVENCDSSGLSALLIANRLVTGLGGELRIVSSSKKIMTLIKITQLDKVLNVCETIEQAVLELSEFEEEE